MNDLETLMVVHEKLHAGDILRSLVRVHLPLNLVHPQQQIPHHVQEAEEVVRVVQSRGTGLARRPQLIPRLHHLQATLELR